jgi:phage I-like protein
MENDVKNIAKALGLEETASETAILAAIDAQAAERARVVTTAGVKPEATSDELVTALAAKIGSGQPDPAQFVPVEQVTALQTALTTLQAEITDGKAATAVDDAIAKGKLLPSLRDWGLTLFKADAGQFSAFVDKAPSLTVTQLGNKRVAAGSEDGLSEADELAITMMGLDRAEFIKTRNAEKAA